MMAFPARPVAQLVKRLFHAIRRHAGPDYFLSIFQYSKIPSWSDECIIRGTTKMLFCNQKIGNF